MLVMAGTKFGGPQMITSDPGVVGRAGSRVYRRRWLHVGDAFASPAAFVRIFGGLGSDDGMK